MTDTQSREALHNLRSYATRQIRLHSNLLELPMPALDRATSEEQLGFWRGVREKASAHCCIWHRPLTQREVAAVVVVLYAVLGVTLAAVSLYP